MIGSPSRSTWSEGREGEKQFSKRGVLGELSKKGRPGTENKNHRQHLHLFRGSQALSTPAPASGASQLCQGKLSISPLRDPEPEAEQELNPKGLSGQASRRETTQGPRSCAHPDPAAPPKDLVFSTTYIP